MTFKEYIIKREKEYTGAISNPDDLIEINDAEEYHKDYLEIVKDDFLHRVMLTPERIAKQMGWDSYDNMMMNEDNIESITKGAIDMIFRAYNLEPPFYKG
jgi:hypothetical protein